MPPIIIIDGPTRPTQAQEGGNGGQPQPQRRRGGGDVYDAEEALESLYGGYNLPAPSSSTTTATTAHDGPGYESSASGGEVRDETMAD